MHLLYEINGISFEELLKKDNNSKTYIKNNLNKYYYFLTYLLHKRRHSAIRDGWVKLNITKLKKLLGNSKMNGKNCHFIDRIRKDLKRWGIIKSKYRKNILGETITRTSFAKIVDEVYKLGYKEHISPYELKLWKYEEKLTGVYAQIQRSLSHLTIEEKEATEFADYAFRTKMKLPAKLNGWIMNTDRRVDEDVWRSWKASIQQIVIGHYEVTVQHRTEGRVYTAVTSFPKKMKSYLRLNGKKLVQLDCSCSQPLLFAVFLRANYKQLTPDMALYIELVQAGKFYQHIQSLLEADGLAYNADSFKAEFFSKVFYSKEKQFGAWRKLFHEAFPGVSNAILLEKKVTLGAKAPSKTGKMVNVGGYPELLSNKLSLLESEIMIMGVAKRLYASDIDEFLTVHDALLIPEEYADVAYNIMLEEYQNYGITPTIKIEEIK